MRLVVHDNYDYRILVSVEAEYSKEEIVSAMFSFGMNSYRPQDVEISSGDIRKILRDPLLEPFRDILAEFEGTEDMNEFSVYLHRKAKEINERD